MAPYSLSRALLWSEVPFWDTKAFINVKVTIKRNTNSNALILCVRTKHLGCVCSYVCLSVWVCVFAHVRMFVHACVYPSQTDRLLLYGLPSFYSFLFLLRLPGNITKNLVLRILGFSKAHFQSWAQILFGIS